MPISQFSEVEPLDTSKPHLLITKGPQQGKTILLDLEHLPLVLGRLAGEVDVVLQTSENKVSRKHIRLKYRPEDENYLVEDIGSSNGTLLNGEYLAVETPLFPGDTIACGDVELVFYRDTGQKSVPLAFLPGQTERVYLEDSLEGVARLEILNIDKGSYRKLEDPRLGEVKIPLRRSAVMRLTPGYTFKIGRRGAPENDLQLMRDDDEARKVSRRHAEIKEVGGNFYIIDGGGANPTWVKGDRVYQNQPRCLEDGDSITIGPTLLRFRAPRLPLSAQSAARRNSDLTQSSAVLRFAAPRSLEGPACLVLPEDRQILIGRAEGNDLRLSDRSVSRSHARLVYEAEHFMLADVGSSNGTLLNGKRIEGFKILQYGDRLQVGDFEFIFEEYAPVEANHNGNGQAEIEDSPATGPVDLSEPVLLRLGAANNLADAGSDAKSETIVSLLVDQQSGPIVHPLRQIAPFDELDAAIFKKLTPYFKEVRFKAGQEMTREGGNQGAFYAILEGRVSVTRSPYEKERVSQRLGFGTITTKLGVGNAQDKGEAPLKLGELGPGSIYGERTIFADQPFVNRLIAEEDVQALRLEERTFVRDLKADSTILSFFQQQVSAVSASNWLNSTELFHTMSDKTRREMVKRLRYREYEAGQMLTERGKPADEFFIVVGGMAKEYVAESPERETVTATFEEGDTFGDGIVAANETYPSTVRAEGGKTECYVLARADFDSVLTKSGDPTASLVAPGGLAVRAVLKRVGPFRMMPPQVLGRIGREMNLRIFKKGEIIVRQNDPATAFYIIRSGKVEVSFIGSDGKERPDNWLGPGQYFGEDAVFTKVPRPWTVRAVEDCQLLALYSHKLDEVMSLGKNYDIGPSFAKQLRLNFRPKQVAEVQTIEQVAPTGETVYLLSRGEGEKVRLIERSFFLWTQMDGNNSVNDLSMEYMSKYKSFYPGIKNLIGQLQAARLLEVPEIDEKLVGPDVEKSAGLFSRLNLKHEFKRIDRVFDRIYNYGGQVFFWKPVTWAMLALTGLGSAAFAYFSLDNSEGYPFGLLFKNTVLAWPLVFILAMIASFIPHELAHGLTCKAFGQPVLSGGFGLRGPFPYFFVNTDEMWNEKRRPRIIVNLAGPFCNVLIAAICCLLMFLTQPDSFLRAILYQIAFANLVLVLMNLDPSVETDGYDVARDWYEISRLRGKALVYLNTHVLKRAAPRPFTPHEIRVFKGYLRNCLAYKIISIPLYLLVINFFYNWLIRLVLVLFGVSSPTGDSPVWIGWICLALAGLTVIWLLQSLFKEILQAGLDEDKG